MHAAWWALACAAIGLGQPANAADASAASAAALKVLSISASDDSAGPAAGSRPRSAARASITVQKGESIDAVIRRGLPGLPLRDDFMRQALAKANPSIFPKGQTYPVRPGTVLQLPAHEELRQMIVSHSPAAAALFQGDASATQAADKPSGPDKRHWVRFP